MNKTWTIISLALLWALFITAVAFVATRQVITFSAGTTQAVLALCGLLGVYSILRSAIFHLSTPYVPVKGMFGERYAIIVDVAVSVMGILTYGLIRRAVCITEGAFHKSQVKEYQAMQKRRTRWFVIDLSLALSTTIGLGAYLALA